MDRRKTTAKSLTAMAALVAVALFLPALPASASGGARPASGLRTGGPQPAQNLVLPRPVVVALVDADAAFRHLPLGDFIGVRQAYYAYDTATSTYWAGAQVVPLATAYRALVSSQDDGGYTVFHKSPRSGWVAVDDGMAGAAGTKCSAYRVSVPAAVLAAWHWRAGTCTPASSGSGPLLLTYLAQARAEWSAGATAISAKEAYYWTASATDLEAALSANAPGTGGFRAAAHELVELSKLPDAMQTAAQSGQNSSLTAELNSFFGTNGLYGSSAPSPTSKAFVATLQQEANLGTLSSNLVADPRLGRLPSAFAPSAVACPVITGVTAGSVFGCKLETFKAYYMVGTVRTAEATRYDGFMTEGAPFFECKADGLSTAEQVAVKKMGGGCRA